MNDRNDISLTTTHDTGTTNPAAGPHTQEFTVSGMTCEHCVRSVTEEVQEIAGVTDVTVDLASGALVVTSTGPLSGTAVRSAVVEAGYHLA